VKGRVSKAEGRISKARGSKFKETGNKIQAFSFRELRLFNGLRAIPDKPGLSRFCPSDDRPAGHQSVLITVLIVLIRLAWILIIRKPFLPDFHFDVA
jgi:hypothetical protein